jgi:hypothetical protein
MTPALRAATVVTAFTLSYGMIAATPAAADVVAAGTTAEVGPTSTVAPQALATTLRAKPYDVNGDGYSDAVVGAPGEGIGTTSQAGMLHVLYGRSTGITASGDRIIHQGTAGVPGSPEEGDWFGWTNASGDFNADGYADIAVSARAESVAAADVAGLVQVFYGSPTGPQTGNVTTLEVPREGLELGSALAAGHTRSFLAEPLPVVVGVQPGGTAVEQGHGTARQFAVVRVVADSDGEVGVAVAVDVSCGQRVSESVDSHRRAGHLVDTLREFLVRGGQSAGRAGVHENGAGVIPWAADCEVVFAVAVEISGSQR